MSSSCATNSSRAEPAAPGRREQAAAHQTGGVTAECLTRGRGRAILPDSVRAYYREIGVARPSRVLRAIPVACGAKPLRMRALRILDLG